LAQVQLGQRPELISRAWTFLCVPARTDDGAGSN
jgi:hypothetical protein